VKEATLKVRVLSWGSTCLSQGLVLIQVRDINVFKRHLKERLLSGWLIVTGDPVCTEDFRKRYYGDNWEDVEGHLVAVTVRSRCYVYTDVDVIMLVRKKKELEGVLGDVERALRLHFERAGGECKPLVEYMGVFAKLSIARVVEKVLKEMKKTASQRAEATRCLDHGASRS
jgi:hypothetical protein